MAQKPKAFSYYVALTEPHTWRVTKVEGAHGGDDMPLAEYTVTFNEKASPQWKCNCPAHFHTKRRGFVECKHVPMVKRWMNIQTRRGWAEGIIYLNTQDDRWYPVPTPIGLN
jgi:hypothetical protein